MKYLTIYLYSSFSLSLILLISGCGGSGGGDSGNGAQITENLSAKALDIVTLDPRIGYPLKVSVSIDAVEAKQDVGLAFFAIDKDRPIVRQIALGTGSISQVAAGTASYEVDLDIPSNVETPGDYFIGVVVDAANIVAETDEADNDASTIATLSIDPVPNLFIENMEADRTAIELQENSSFEDQTLPVMDGGISLDNVVNSDAGATLTWGVKGAEVPIEVETYAVLRLTKTAPSGATPLSQSRDALTISPTPSGADTSNSHDVPLYLWNSEELRYMNAYGRDTTVICIPDFSNPCAPTLPIEYLPIGPIGEMLVPTGVVGETDVPVTEFDRKSAHLDFYFPGKLAQEIGIAARGNFVSLGAIIPPPDLSQADIQALRDFMPTGLPQDVTAAFCVNIRPVDTTIIEDSNDDNDICTPVALLLPALPPLPPVPVIPPTPPLLTTPSNPVAFEQLYRNAWGGSFFGFGLNFSASTTADNRGVIINGQGSVPAQVFGQSIEFIRVEGRAQVLPISDRDSPPSGQSPGFSLSLSHLGLVLRSISVSSGSVGPLEISFSKDVFGIEKTILVGPVPVKLEASLAGNLGVKYQININENIDGDPTGEGINLVTTPFANAEISASAAITVLIADVGIEGVLTLLEEEFNIIAGATINVLDISRHPFDSTSEIKFVPRLRVINVLTGAKGAMNVFVSVDVPVFRKCSWGFFTGICPGIAEVKYPYNLASYTAWEKSDVLFDKSFIIHMVTLPGEPVAYYQ